MANKIRFKVGGIEYSIFSEDSERYINSIAENLEHKMNLLAKQNPFLSTTMVAVLAAMDAVDAQKKCELENEQLRREVKNLTEQNVMANRENERLLRKLGENRFEF